MEWEAPGTPVESSQEAPPNAEPSLERPPTAVESLPSMRARAREVAQPLVPAAEPPRASAQLAVVEG